MSFFEYENNKIWQWDSGIKLKVNGTIPNNDYVHFEKDGEILSLEPASGYVQIPNQMLRAPGRLKVYAYTENTDISRTLISALFEVYERAKPPEYIFIDTPAVTYPELVSLRNDLNAIKQQLGTVSANASTVEYTQPASASVSMSASGTQFSFQIPKGVPGQNGSKGDKGDPGETIKPKLLWTNPKPKTAMQNVDITFNTPATNCTFLIIEFLQMTSGDAHTMAVVPIGSDAYAYATMSAVKETYNDRARWVSSSSETMIHVSYGYSSGSTSSASMIPTRIWGI